MTDFLDEKRRELDHRLKELKPFVEEYRRLEAAAVALAGIGGSPSEDSTRSPARRRRTTASRREKPEPPPKKGGRPKTRSARRRKGGGTRSAQALAVVRDQPGITIPELAARMRIQQNYLYRVLPNLEQEKLVEKRGRAWYAIDSQRAHDRAQAIFPGDEVWCPVHERYHSPPAHKAP